MKHKTRFFTVYFHPSSRHWISVLVHPSIAALRRTSTIRGHDASRADALCVECSQPAKDQCIAEIHFAADRLNLDVIAHECSHAAFHRTIIFGLDPAKDDNFQEYVACDTGVLTQRITNLFKREGIKLNYRKP